MRRKTVFLSLIFLFLSLLIFKGWLYRSIISYREIGQRHLMPIENQAIIKDLEHWSTANPNADLDQIVAFSKQYTTSGIKYTFGACPTNPNQILPQKTATNCIGYSAALHAVCTYLLKKRGLNNTVKSVHKVGNLYVGNFNIHQCFQSPAFKDHDYNVIHDARNGQRFVIDPTVYATLGIESVTEP